MAESDDQEFWLSLLGELGSPSDLAPVQQQTNDDSYLYVDVLPSPQETEQNQNYFTECNENEPQYRTEPQPELYYPSEEADYPQPQQRQEYDHHQQQANHYEWNSSTTLARSPSPDGPDLFADDPRMIWPSSHSQTRSSLAVREESESLYRDRESFSESSKQVEEAVEALVEIPLRHSEGENKETEKGKKEAEVEYFRLGREESLATALTQDRGRHVAHRATATLASTGVSLSSAVSTWTGSQFSTAYRILLSRLSEQQQLMQCAGLLVQTLQVTRSRLEELITAHLVTVLTADDPETRHLQQIQSTHAWQHITLRCAMSSLSWRQKQLLAPLSNHAGADSDSEQVALQHDLKQVLRLREVTAGIVDSVSERIVHTILPLQDPEGLLVASAAGDEDDDPEALEMQEEAIQYALARFFTPPSFQESSTCTTCHLPFGLSLFRHHCRCCGQSYCETHSSHRRRIFRYGYVPSPVRVCDECRVSLDELTRIDQLLFRDARILAYFNSMLIPYTPITADRAIDKALRVADYSFVVARNTLTLNFPTKVVFETIDVLKRYGLSGFAGLLLRKDFMEAIETLKNVVGMDRLLTRLSLHELTACVYYKLAIDRGLRGCLPDAELEIHADTRYLLQETEEDDQAEEKYTCYPAISHDINMAIRFAPLALEIAYLDNAADMRRLGLLHHRLELLCCNADDERAAEQPCYALYATHAYPAQQSQQQEQQQPLEVVLAIRGTHSVQDVVTDIRSMPQAFPPPQDVIEACLGGVLPVSYLDAAVQQQAMLASFLDAATDNDDDHHEQSHQQKEYACGGMARAALWLLSEIGPALRRICESTNNKCIIWLTGHSMGGGVAACLTLLIKRALPMITVKAVVFGCPCCLSSTLSDQLRVNCASVILRDDVVTRITPQSIRALLADILRFRRCVFRHIQQDWSDVMSRAKEVWAPRTRHAYDHSSSNGTLDLAEELMLKGTTVGEAGENLGEKQADEEDDMQMVAPALLQPLWQPGRVIHIYSLRGQLQAAEVSRSFPVLRSIAVQGHIFEDHRSERIFQALLEVRAPRRPPPLWTAYDRASTCSCCQSPFTWHSTFRGAAQEFRDRYNCRNCGCLVCGPCSTQRRPVPRLGMLQPRRLCDRCFLSGDYAQM